MIMSNVHDHLWDDIMQHVYDERRIYTKTKRAWKYASFNTLCDVCYNGSVALIKLLLPSEYVNYHIEGHGGTLLHIASKKRNCDIIRVLLEAGANVNGADRYGWTPLHETAFKGYCENADVLLKGGANVNAQTNLGWTPLYLSPSPHKIRELLIKAGGFE